MKIYSKIAVTSLILPAFVLGAYGASAQTVNLGAANVPALSGTTIPGVSGVALQSYLSAKAAYDGITCTATSTLPSLGGQTLTAGTYCLPSSATFSGTLTLSGDSDDVFVFETSGALTVSSGASLVLNGVSPNNVYFKVGSATVGSDANLSGTILSNGSISLGTGADLNGRALSLTGSVTADPGAINCPNCIATSTFGRLIVNKIVINDNGGTATASTTALFVSGMRVQSGVQYAFVPGTYALTEIIAEGNYAASPWSGNCTAGGSVTLPAGGTATCSITNNDVGGPGVPTTTPTTTPGVPNTGIGGMWNLLIALTAVVFASGGLLTVKREGSLI